MKKTHRPVALKPTASAWRGLALLAVAGGLAPMAHATNGYFPHGFGIKAKGMGGVSIALAQDGFAGVNNPAAAAFAGNRMELGAEVFMPRRDVTRTGFPMPGVFNTAEDSGRTAFLVPEFGYNTRVSDTLGVGLTVYGNGGMNTSYPGGNTTCMNPSTGAPMPGMNPMCGMGKLGVDLMQLIVAPTVAYKFSPQHSVGVSPLFVYQRFEAYGVQGFQPSSVNPAAVTNNGTDTSTGVGIRLGYMGQLTDKVTVGAAYSPKANMSKFKKYAGLFANGGEFDIPENYGLGVAFQVSPTVQLAVDYTRINYSKVPAIGNAATAGPMGGPGGGGFGWRDVEAVKLGVQWQMNAKTTLRFGFNRGTNPVTSANVTPNILAPGVIQSHFTLGGTYALSPKSELSWSFMHAPSVRVTGPSMFNASMPPGTPPLIQETVRMRQNSFAIQYGWKF